MINNNLYILFKEEIYNEAKRLVPLVFKDNDFLSCDLDKLKKELSPKFKSFETEFHLLVSGLCISKSNGENYLSSKIDFDKLEEHHNKLIEWKKEVDKCDLNIISDTIAQDIIDNRKKYKDESLFTLIPKLAKKYIKCHHDSVDWDCIAMLLAEKLKEKNYMLTTTEIKNLKSMI